MTTLSPTVEEITAFKKHFDFDNLNARQKIVVEGSCLGPFLVGYRAGREATLLERCTDSLNAQFADTGEKLMQACTDAGCPAGVDMIEWIKETAKKAKDTDKLYSMDQMRNYGDNHYATRMMLLRQTYENQIESLQAIIRSEQKPDSDRNSFEWIQTGMKQQRIEVLRDAIGTTRNIAVRTFQGRASNWLITCFGQAIANDHVERNHRFFEEAGELVQSCGMSASEAHQLVDYVWNRPVGEPWQEVGGTMVTLAALCYANKLDMHKAAEMELTRVLDPQIMQKIRLKQAQKPKHTPLPQ